MRFALFVIAAAAVWLPVASATARPAPTFCTSIGLTNAAVKKVLGPKFAAKDYPNPGQDMGICQFARGLYGGGSVEVYSASLEAGLLGGYEAKAKVKRPLPALGKGAVLVEGPESPSYTAGGTDIYFTVGSDFVAITGTPAYAKHPAPTTAELLAIARVVRAALA
jgi:hypothetical protein